MWGCPTKPNKPEADLSNPGLLAISGLLKQMIWPVKDGPLFLGRDSSNQVEVGGGHR
jgi:hypothetical protein